MSCGIDLNRFWAVATVLGKTERLGMTPIMLVNIAAFGVRMVCRSIRPLCQQHGRRSEMQPVPEYLDVRSVHIDSQDDMLIVSQWITDDFHL